ncbi:hypothetical protein IGK38_002206 [Enterococcus pernyi]|uniref:hypothetical protein n=1 Tax=Enterococcus TaxID=1350 RepID=UPI0003543396|nr:MULTISPECIES: hypothetical protein [Enterococcus]EGP4752031.1 hypothetical protein [Enterococcus faecium]MZU11682.1 hypothetical protein [Bifidobacterium longum]EGP5129822.1 hypothetical protein [Enterococcus faecium]EGP5495882.1 hypothetical protein [Enterococcus faecium]ELS0445224.1 hypothetical protein [Enterococcus faecium]
MANRVQEIALSEKQLGKKIKAVFRMERDMYVNGSPVRGRVFSASSAEQRDFEIFVPGLRNSQSFTGREEIRLIDPVVRISAKRNNIGNSRSLDLVVYARRLEVLGGNK